jgi:predicted HD phosphohydrolase
MVKLMKPRNQATEKFMEFLFGIFERGMSVAYGKSEISMCSHMLQTANFAEKDGAPPELIAASLLHDIGHFGTDFSLEFNDNRHKAMLSVTRDRFHEHVGGDLLEEFLGSDVAEPVRLHVSAKRYLCAVDPKYFENLAETTRHTLNLQGGIMTFEEVQLFESNPHYHAAAKLRRWDDLATHQERKIPSFENYQKLLESLL